MAVEMPDEEYEVVMGRPLTAEEEYFDSLWPKLTEQSLARNNEALNRLVTLGSGMSAGALILLKEDVCYGWFRVIAAGLFFLALAAAVCGSVPFRQDTPNDPEGIRSCIERASTYKRGWIITSTGLLMAGILSALAGAIVRTAIG